MAVAVPVAQGVSAAAGPTAHVTATTVTTVTASVATVVDASVNGPVAVVEAVPVNATAAPPVPVPVPVGRAFPAQAV